MKVITLILTLIAIIGCEKKVEKHYIPTEKIVEKEVTKLVEKPVYVPFAAYGTVELLPVEIADLERYDDMLYDPIFEEEILNDISNYCDFNDLFEEIYCITPKKVVNIDVLHVLESHLNLFIYNNSYMTSLQKSRIAKLHATIKKIFLNEIPEYDLFIKENDEISQIIQDQTGLPVYPYYTNGAIRNRMALTTLYNLATSNEFGLFLGRESIKKIVLFERGEFRIAKFDDELTLVIGWDVSVGDALGKIVDFD